MTSWSKIPKIELHRHLDCSIRPSTLRELLTALGEPVPSDPQRFAEMYLVKEPMRDLEAVLRKFLAAQKALSSETVLTRITEECIRDAHAEGIEILELRFAPTFIQDGHPDLNFEAIHRAIATGADRCQDLTIKVGLIYIAQRTKPVAIADKVLSFAIEAHQTRPDLVVGVDLADNEAGFDPAPFAPHFMRAKKAGLGITIHAGEALIPEAAANVLTAIEKLGAERIGHGIQIIHNTEVLKRVAREGVLLEICPTSNVLTNSVPTLQAHPIRRLMDAGVKVCVNTDDPGVFDYDLTHEYRALAESHGFTEAEFSVMNAWARAASFVSERTV
ncbi:MAG: adenosine deaminase [Bdellovibrionales bacterium]|nr:adenosine deaminase [Bdellovibrionales bacterium]